MSIYWNSSRFLKHHHHILSTQYLIILIKDVICIRMCQETNNNNMFLNLITQIREICGYLCWLYYLILICCTRAVWEFFFHLWLTPVCYTFCYNNLNQYVKNILCYVLVLFFFVLYLVYPMFLWIAPSLFFHVSLVQVHLEAL